MENSNHAARLTLSAAAEEPLLAAPHGLKEIIASFGDIYKYIGANGQLDPRWQAEFLERVTLPFPLRLSWDPSHTVNQMTCHRRMTGTFASVLNRIQELGLCGKVTSFGGCFAFRPQRTGSKLSVHSWGIAVDLNPPSNPQGSPGDMDTGIIDIFLAAGFEWGGTWQGKARDPMHFQFCTGY
ncbi:MAG: M15 family metallopeptidase [Terriglobales bacterium]